MIDPQYLSILAEAGIKPTIVPCAPGTKLPAVKWAVRNADFVDGTILDTRAEAQAILTGTRSGDVLVIDVDTKLQGFEHFQALEEGALGPLPETMEVRSPTGGLHLYFRHPAQFRNVRNVNNVTGIDIRAEGGIALVPGSKHPTASGLYTVEKARPIALLPAKWADWLPRARRDSTAVDPVYAVVEPSELRERLDETSKGKRGDGWGAWRKCVHGERMFRIEGGPGAADLPIVHGVDEFVTKHMIWPLAHAEGWSEVDPDSFVRLVDPSFETVRRDAAAIGGSATKLVPEELARKWEQATAKAQADIAAAKSWVERITEQVRKAKEPGALPPILQLDRRYLVLDDRTDCPRYTDLVSAEGVPALAGEFWAGVRETQTMDKAGLRAMDTRELMGQFGKPIERIILDYTHTAPSLEGTDLILGPRRLPIPAATFDPDVAAWLHAMDPSDGILEWIAWTAPHLAQDTVPALVMVGAAHVGKTLLGHGVARSQGLLAPEALGPALGRFAAPIATSPILVGDEGMPRDSHGHPLTQEFRRFATTNVHLVEMKGVDRRLIVRGAPRIILSANAMGSLFSTRGALTGDDVDAIVRRLFVVDIGPDQAAEAHRLAESLGRTTADPVRLARVAAHCRWIQENTPRGAEMLPRSGNLKTELRKGSDIMARALQVLEDTAGSVPWSIVDKPKGVVWVRMEFWARACEAQSPQALGRASEPYVKTPARKLGVHPITAEPMPDRARWVGLDLAKLQLDGIEIP